MRKVYTSTLIAYEGSLRNVPSMSTVNEVTYECIGIDHESQSMSNTVNDLLSQHTMEELCEENTNEALPPIPPRNSSFVSYERNHRTASNISTGGRNQISRPLWTYPNDSAVDKMNSMCIIIKVHTYSKIMLYQCFYNVLYVAIPRQRACMPNLYELA